MRLKGDILIQFQLRPLFNNRLSFFLKVQLSITIGIIVSIIFIGIGIYSRQYSKAKFELQTQGVALSSNLSKNAEPFLVDYNKDQLNQFLSVMLDNPLVMFAGIINAHLGDPKIEVLQKQPVINLRFVSSLIQDINFNQFISMSSTDIVRYENDLIICITPILSQYVFPDDEAIILYDYPRHQGIIGYSFIAYKLPLTAIFSLNMTWLILAFILIATFIGLILGRSIANHFLLQVKTIHRSLLSYSFGDPLTIPIKTNDEISDIAVSINGLIELINMQINKIIESNSELKEQFDNQLIEINKETEDMERFTTNQRSFVAHFTQEIKQLMTVLVSTDDAKSVEILTAHIQDLIHQLIVMLQDNQEFLMITDLQPLSLNELCSALKPLLVSISRINQNDFKVDLDDHLIFNTSRVHLSQSLIQLVMNASRYTKNGIIQLSAHRQNNMIELSVIDTGVGIQSTKVNNVLKSLDNDNFSEATVFSTLGMGLVLVHRFCKNIDALLHCEKQDVGGSKITITHPVQPKINLSQLKKVLIISNRSVALKAIQASIQQTSNWQCDIIPEGGTVNDQVRVVLIDLDGLDDVYQQLKITKSKLPNSQIVLLTNGKAIMVKMVIQKQDESLMSLVRLSITQDTPNIYLQGVSHSLKQSFIEDFPDANIFTRFSYKNQIDIRVISEFYFKNRIRQDVILVFDTITSLKTMIEQKGLPINKIIQII